MALSLGGYYAPRAAALEPRYACCVAWGAQWDYHAIWAKRLDELASGKVLSLSVPPEHLQWVLGVDSQAAALKKLEGFRLDGIVQKMACPFLLLHGGGDEQIPLALAEKCFAAVGSKQKTFKVFQREEGGFHHCQVDNVTIGVHFMWDWIEDVLKPGHDGRDLACAERVTCLRASRAPRPGHVGAGVTLQTGTQMTQPLYITEAEVARLVTVKDAIAALEEMFASWGDPLMQNLPRQRAQAAGRRLQPHGRVLRGEENLRAEGLCGRQGLDPGPRADLLERGLFAQGDDRVRPARPDPHRRGERARHQADGQSGRPHARRHRHRPAVALPGRWRSARCGRSSACWCSPAPPRAARPMPARWRRTLGIEVRPAPTAEACVGEADVVVTITKSAEPVFRADWLTKGAHVNVAGANSADRREVDADTVLRAAVKATDQVAQAKVEAGRVPRPGRGRQARLDRCLRTGRHRQRQGQGPRLAVRR